VNIPIYTTGDIYRYYKDGVLFFGVATPRIYPKKNFKKSPPHSHKKNLKKNFAENTLLNLRIKVCKKYYFSILCAK